MEKVVVGAAVVCAAAAAFAAATVVYQQRKGSSGKWGMAEDIVKRFGEECGTPIEKLKKVAEAMVFEMNKGLASEGGSKLKMLISFVDNLPSGNEKGMFYALDLGGTNFRALRVQLAISPAFRATVTRSYSRSISHSFETKLTKTTAKMRFSFASAFALSSLFLGALAAPTGDVLSGVSGVSGLTQAGSLTKTYSSTEKTTTIIKNETVYSVVSTLYTNVQQYTSSINKTVEAVPAQPSEEDKKKALIEIKADIKSIASLIVDASVKIGKIEVSADVDVSAIVSLVVKLVFEIVATLQHVVAILGGTITVLLGSVLTLLVNAISALLVALQDILGDVIATVWSIVSGLLPFVGDILVGLGEVLKGDCGCLTL